MAAPLNTCTAIEQRGVVRFFGEKVMTANDIHKEMLPSTVSIACHSSNPLKQRISGERFSDNDAVE